MRSVHGINKRRLLEMIVRQAFADMRSAGQVDLSRLSGVSFATSAEQDAVKAAAFAAATQMEPVFGESAHELKLKFGHEKLDDHSSASEFLRRLLGSAPYNALYAYVDQQLSASNDPTVIATMADKERRSALVTAITEATDNAIWREMDRAEARLASGS